MVLADTAGAAPIIITLLGSTGLIGAIVALLKLRPDVNSAAVSQAQGAMEVMQQLNQDMEKNRDYWRERYEQCNQRCVALEEELHQARVMIRRLASDAEE